MKENEGVSDRQFPANVFTATKIKTLCLMLMVSMQHEMFLLKSLKTEEITLFLSKRLFQLIAYTTSLDRAQQTVYCFGNMSKEIVFHLVSTKDLSS